MLQESFSKDKRNLRSILLSADFVVVGGGILGVLEVYLLQFQLLVQG